MHRAHSRSIISSSSRAQGLTRARQRLERTRACKPIVVATASGGRRARSSFHSPMYRRRLCAMRASAVIASSSRLAVSRSAASRNCRATSLSSISSSASCGDVARLCSARSGKQCLCLSQLVCACHSNERGGQAHAAPGTSVLTVTESWHMRCRIEHAPRRLQQLCQQAQLAALRLPPLLTGLLRPPCPAVRALDPLSRCSVARLRARLRPRHRLAPQLSPLQAAAAHAARLSLRQRASRARQDAAGVAALPRRAEAQARLGSRWFA